MRGLDTNILLRALIFDDPVQAEAVKRGFEEAQAKNERLFISTIVLCEVVWTLRGAVFACNRT